MWLRPTLMALPSSVTRSGVFWIFLATIFLQKWPKYFIAFRAIYENVNFYVKPAVASFWATVGKFGLLFIPTSAHTASKAAHVFVHSFVTDKS